MNNPVLYELQRKAALDHIDVIWTDGLRATTPPAASVKRRKIVMNMRWIHQNEITFQLGHEMAHIYHDDVDHEFLYYSNRYTKSEVENAAHAGAIDLIMPFYMHERTDSMASPVDFMECFEVPGYLSEMVDKKMRAYIYCH
ncbi:ImmA/IrrE family metallo-endopeptidase [Levilactobacillus wangkuiensis]|uniref:ImmA/IrrE family metallo-endopeptidase n=1 Tax=Levilactobacillus wangkuiensis TaxID=2799566 RepID=UPI001941BEA2|nr:ImmA/IrrE family metallo-endopeptidase [Levilactobacillus wangkuiensis]